MHAGVQLDVDRIVFEAFLPQYFHQLFERVQVGNAGFHARLNNFREEVGSGGEDEDGERNAITAQLQALHRVGNGQVIGSGPLHHGRKLHGTMAIGICLDQHQQFGFGIQKGTEIPVVFYRGPQI